MPSHLGSLTYILGIKIISSGLQYRILSHEASPYPQCGPSDLNLCFQKYSLQKAASDRQSITEIKPAKSTRLVTLLVIY